MEDSRENNNELNNILHDKNVIDLLRNNVPVSTVQMLPLYNLNIVKPIDTLDDFRNNGNVECCMCEVMYM